MANTKFGIKQVEQPTPAWVVKAIVGITVVLQMAPNIINTSPLINEPTKELIHLIFAFVNIGVVAFGPMFGVNKSEN